MQKVVGSSPIIRFTLLEFPTRPGRFSLGLSLR